MILFYILVALAPFDNPPLIWRLLGSTGTFKVLGALCLVYAVCDLIRRGHVPAFFRSWQARAFIALFLLASVSFFTKGLAHFLQDSTLLIYTDFVVFFFITLALVRSLKRLRWVLFSIAAGIAYGSADIIREWFTYGRFNAMYRAGSSVGDGNYFSTSAALILPFVFLMIFHARTRWEKLFFGGCLLLTLPAVMLTGSRGGFVAVAVSFLYLFWHLRHRARNFALISLVALPLLVLFPASPVRRMLHPVNKNGLNTEKTRLDAWVAGLRMFKDHPVFGVGLGNFKPMMPRYADPGVDFKTMAHNTYIEFLAEMGLAGLLLFGAMVFCAFGSLRRVRKRARTLGLSPGLYIAALSLESGLLGFLAGACFLSAEYQKLLWFVIFLSVCLPGLARRVRVEVETAAPETSLAPVGIGEEL